MTIALYVVNMKQVAHFPFISKNEKKKEKKEE